MRTMTPSIHTSSTMSFNPFLIFEASFEPWLPPLLPRSPWKRLTKVLQLFLFLKLFSLQCPWGATLFTFQHSSPYSSLGTSTSEILHAMIGWRLLIPISVLLFLSVLSHRWATKTLILSDFPLLHHSLFPFFTSLETAILPSMTTIPTTKRLT